MMLHDEKAKGFHNRLPYCLGLFALVASFSLLPLGLRAVAAGQGDEEMQNSVTTMVLPLADAARGKGTFVAKGCVICHSVNGVGGTAAPALDAGSSNTVDLLGFVSRMWRGAPAMLELQAVELGYQIELNAQEIADLATFAADRSTQQSFQLSDIPEPMQTWMLNEPYWDDGDWPEGMKEYPDLEEFFNSEKGGTL